MRGLGVFSFSVLGRGLWCWEAVECASAFYRGIGVDGEEERGVGGVGGQMMEPAGRVFEYLELVDFARVLARGGGGGSRAGSGGVALVILDEVDGVVLVARGLVGGEEEAVVLAVGAEGVEGGGGGVLEGIYVVGVAEHDRSTDRLNDK